MTPTRPLARFVVETNAEQIPDAVLHEGKRCIINVLAVALHATQDPAAQIGVEYRRTGALGIFAVTWGGNR